VIRDGRLENVTFLPSPNFNQRPDEGDIHLLVIHNISLPPGQFGTGDIQALFLNGLDYDQHPYFDTLRGLEVSSHLLIERDGKVTQFVPFHQRAWHAGVSEYEGRSNCNDYSIGIELEGTDQSGFTDAQYRRLVELSAIIINTYPNIGEKHIVGHSDIAPGRKTDPGESFDWARYRLALNTHISREA